MSLLTKLTQHLPVVVTENLEIGHVQTIIKFGTFTERFDAFANPDKKSALAAILIHTDSDPNIQLRFFARHGRVDEVSTQLKARKLFNYGHTGVYSEVYADMQKLRLDPIEDASVSSDALNIRRPNSMHFRFGNLHENRVQSVAKDVLHNLFEAITSSDFVSSDLRIREAMISKIGNVMASTNFASAFRLSPPDQRIEQPQTLRSLPLKL